MNRDFDKWINKFKESIANYTYYVEFDTVYKNVNSYLKELKLLNNLIGSKNIESDFVHLISQNPEVLSCIPILFAKREKEVFCMDEEGAFDYSFDKMNHEIEQYIKFMRKTGLFNLMSNKLVNNLIDYAYGVEAGLNSNGRKNRGGHLMEDLVESFIKEAGFVKNKTYFKEMYLSDLEKISGLNLSSISNNGETEKRFDFVIIKNGCYYACECNFYSSGGSKLNETARSYKTIALESRGIKNFKFIWFTDGIGWISARNNLKETFDILDDIYCIEELENGVLKNL